MSPADPREPIAERDAIRQAALAKRAALDPDAVRRWGDAIAARTLTLLAERGDETVFAYLDMPNEVPTRAIVAALLHDGRRVVVPRVVRGSQAMTLHAIDDLERDLRPGLWGIPTPRRRCPQVDPASVDVALVPCVAFDGEGYRIGHGGGFYDRFLTAYPHVYAIGLAFEWQRVPTCLPQPWDVPLDALVTEAGVWTFRREGPRPR